MSTTSAERVLQQKKVTYEAREYAPQGKGRRVRGTGPRLAARGDGEDVVVALADGTFVLCVPGTVELSVKSSPAKSAPSRLGCRPGRSRTPHRLPGGRHQSAGDPARDAGVDAPVLAQHATIGVNGGRRG